MGAVDCAEGIGLGLGIGIGRARWLEDSLGSCG